MELRKCEICGKPTAEADFSKSYKNRCKPCVAELTRERRTEQKEEKVNDTYDDLRESYINEMMECYAQGDRHGLKSLAGDAIEEAYKRGRLDKESENAATEKSQWQRPNIVQVPVKVSRLFELTKAALQGLLASPVWMQLQMQNTKEACKGKTLQEHAEYLKKEIAEDATELARATLSQLEQIEQEKGDDQ